MPTKITLNDILPPIWASLDIEMGETSRPLSRDRYDHIMKDTGTVVSPTVLKRMWETLAHSEFAAFSPYTRNTLFLDLPRIEARLVSNGHRISKITHITHTTEHTSHTHTTHTPGTTDAHTGEGSE